MKAVALSWRTGEACCCAAWPCQAFRPHGRAFGQGADGWGGLAGLPGAVSRNPGWRSAWVWRRREICLGINTV